jgi:2-hydroxychromene-2-carboxylate isomerase
MARTLEFYFDYGSPYSYLADTQVEAIARRAGASLARKPMLLGGAFKAMWVDGCNLNEMGEVAQVLTAAGIDAARIGNRIQDQDVKDRLKATTEEAVARGVFGAPTSFMGDMMFFGNDRLPFVEMALKGDLE